MLAGLLRLRSALTLRRALAAILLLLIVRDLRSWWSDVDLQTIANIFCSRTDFPGVTGPSGQTVTSRRIDCRLLESGSTTYVYLHHPQDQDDRMNLIFRYQGGTPRITWIDAHHLVIQTSHLLHVDRLLSQLGSVRIALDEIDSSSPAP